jgi:hypothetical protein
MYLLAPSAALAFYLNQEKKNSECEASRADRIRGTYENKIRFFCAPEKFFEVFAGGRKEDGSPFMTYSDFLHAMTPYDHCELKNTSEEYLKKFKPKIV